MSTPDESHRAARLKTVKDHVHSENLHDLNGTMQTFGDSARYDDEAWSEHYVGRDQVQAYYERLMEAVPDLSIDVKREHASQDAIVLECTIRGTHQGPWRGLPATGHRLNFHLCAVYTFDERDRLVGERIYYDRATVLKQLGVFREPEGLPGRLTVLLTHPVTMIRTIARAILRR